MPKKPSVKKPIQKKRISKSNSLETQLAIINNIGQMMTEGLDLNSAIKRVGERLRDALKLKNIAITIADLDKELIIAQYFYSNRESFSADHFLFSKYKLSMRLSMRGLGRSWVVNTSAEKSWRKFASTNDENDIPKSFILLPLLTGKDPIGGITIADFEKENAFTDISIGMLETIASNMGTAIQNVRLFDETQRLLKQTEQRATELQIINNIGQTLTEGGDLNSTIERVGERLREALKVENIGFSVWDEKLENIVAKYYYRNGKPASSETWMAGDVKMALRLSARGGGRSWVVNRNAEKSWRKFGGVNESDAPKSFVQLPLLAGGKLIGGITIGNYEKEDAFTDFPITMLETIASNMGTAIQNARLFDETQRLLKETEQRATELQIINNIGQTLTEGGDLNSTIERVGDRLREALKVENIGFSVWDEKLEHIVAKYYYRNGKPASSETWMAGDVKVALRLSARGGGRSWVVNRNAEKSWRKFGGVNESDSPKSFVQLPLLAGGKLIGGITIGDYEKEDAFTDFPITMLETIASNMGTAIQNARLFDETQRLLKETEQRATELQIINNIGQTLTESGDLESMIQRVGERIQEALSVNNIIISIFDKETERIIANYMVRNGEQTTLSKEDFNMHAIKIMMRASARRGGVSWVVKDDEVEKFWHRWRGSIGDDVPKSVVVLPLLAGREVIGGISLADYEKENAFTDLSLNLLETIASNMGTAVQNVRLFEETKRLFSEAEEARAAAEQANKAKSTFLANMSHELRTPLNAIMGFTSIVRTKADGILPEKQLSNLDKVTSSSEHLLGLINTVLDIAKVEAGRMDVIPAKFNLNIVAEQCVNLTTPLLKPNVTLEKQLDENISIIYSDQDKIKQIVLNLLSNAIKFTHTGKVILSVIKVNEEKVSISVKDSGIGISEEGLSKVFEEFQQAETTTTRQYGGTGLGLTISRNLARLLGGDLTVTSELDKGSTFTLTIPIKYENKSALEQIQEPASADLQPDSVSSIESQPEKVAEKIKGTPAKTILIVEDTELNINFITQVLEDEYNLLFAKDGAQGVNMAQQNNPDLILMDISLPVMDGYEATRQIRITSSSTPIIGLSAYAMIGDADKAKEAGCNDYLTKPINKEILLKKIKDYLR